jgi:phage minor structural protein
MKPISIFDGKTRRRLCYLENAYNISYTKTANSLWTGGFTLPLSDTKNKYCSSMNLVELWDVDSSGADKYIGLFRIQPSVSERKSGDCTVQYTLEHVLATLLDDTMQGFHEIGNLTVFTNEVINYILTKQTEQKWILGYCDYKHQFLYGWQDENLLGALFSVPRSFEEDDWCWTFDTKAFPWTINLKKMSSDAVTDIRYRKNINSIKKTSDPSNLTTRLYCYGYGEGDNKLNIKALNGGAAYIDSPNTAKYGVITRVWTDGRYTKEESLLSAGHAMLKALEEPVVSYEVDIATVQRAANLEVGDMVRIADEETDFYTRVVEFSKSNVSGAPRSGKVTLANKTTDIAQSVADLADRQRISTTYAHGSETVFAVNLADNADSTHPAELTFVVPDNAVHVNAIKLNVKIKNFRAYSKGTSTRSFSNKTTDYDYETTQTYESDGVELLPENVKTDDIGGYGNANHNHGIDSGTQLVTDIDMMDGLVQYVTWVPSGSHVHKKHYHYIDIDPHNHEYEIPSHSHSISYGIYESDSTPTSIDIKIQSPNDDAQKTIGTYNDQQELEIEDLITKMTKESNGEIARGQHSIIITPNALARIECSVQIQLFTRSTGSEGQY